MRGTVIDAFGIDAARVVVVPHGVAGGVAPTGQQIGDVRRRYGLGEGPYVVYPAITHPHKNHRLLLEVMARHWTDPTLRLVLLGGAGAADAEVGRAIVDLGLGDRVVRPGRVPAADRDALIAGATALVFPSRYEGFGAPLIEAMALDTPVICGDHPALREVAGSAAIVLPDDVDALVRRAPGRRPPARRTDRGWTRTPHALHTGGLRRGAPRRLSPDAHLMRIVVLCPHFAPDTAPTGHVMSRIVGELAARGHEAHVVTALPWYRNHAIEPGWTGRLVRQQRTDWGSITRVSPFPGGDRRDLPRRALGYIGFSLLVGIAALRAGGWFRRADAVIAMSPPLTLGLTGWAAKLAHRAPLVFNIQDVFPDAAVETGAITDRRVIAVARWLERVSYRLADAVTVLSTDMADNVMAKIGPRRRLEGQGDPELRRHRRAPSVGPGDAVPARAGDRGRAGRDVRRQRRLLAVARDGRRRRPGDPRGDVRDQRSGCCPPAARGCRRRSRQRPLRRPPTRTIVSTRCSRPATSTSSRCGAGSVG